MNALSWLNDLMRWLGRWVPRVLLIKAGEAALWCGRNGRTRDLAPGLYTFWPITTDITVFSTKKRTLEMCGQVNGREVVALVVTWRILQAAALLEWNSPAANIDDRSAAAIALHYTSDVATAVLAAYVLADLRREFGPSGIEIERADVAQRAPIRTLRLMNDWATHEAPTL